MAWKSLLNLNGLNFWLVASGIGLNLIFTFMALFFSFYGLVADAQVVTSLQLTLIIAVFFTNALTGWLIGKMADDQRGPTYGLLSSLGSVGLIVVVVLPAGILGLLLAVIAVAGGINGGILSLRRRQKS